MSAADRNLLFGVFALQMDFLSQDELIQGMQAWVLEKSQPLENLLVAKGLMTRTQRDLLLPLVEHHITQHGGDAGQSLRALSGVSPGVNILKQVEDVDLHRSLGSLRIRNESSEEGFPSTVLYQETGIRYLQLRPHAKGGLGEVFVARDTELDREVALKEIQDQHAHDPHSKSRFVMEAEVTGKLEHPGIVPVYGLGCYPDGRPFYAMRLIRGDNLHEVIRQFHKTREADGLGPGNPFESVEFRRLLGRFVDVCQAVGYAHARGVLHRDLKPKNIMIGKHGETLVVDWGLAKVKGRAEPAPSGESLVKLSSGSSLGETLPGRAIGTPSYMSPEQAEGRLDQLGPATDIYGLGATLFTLLTKEKPVEGTSDGELIQRTLKGELRHLRAINPQIPKPLEAICKKATALSPLDRYSTCQNLAEDVESYLAGERVTAYSEPWTDRARRWVRKHRTLAASTIAGICVAMLGLAIVLAVVTGLNHKLDGQNTQLAGLNQELDEQNAKLITANQNEQTQRVIAELNRRVAKGQEIVANINAMIAEEQAELQAIAKAKAERQDQVSQTRLRAANKIASKIVFDVDPKLESIATASAVRQELLNLVDQLLNTLLVDETNTDTLQTFGCQLMAQGSIAQQFKDLRVAKARFARAESVLSKVFESKPSALTTADHSWSLKCLGDVALMRGEIQEAKSSYKQAHDRDKWRTQMDGNDGFAEYDLAISFEGLGEVAIYQGDLHSAAKFYNEALTINRTLMEKSLQDPAYKGSYSICVERIGYIAEEQGQLEMAELCRFVAMTISKKLASQFPHDLRFQHDLWADLSQLGDISLKMGQTQAAETHYKEAFEIQRLLALQEPNSIEYQNGLAICYGNLGDLARRKGRLAAAEQHYAMAVDILKELISRDRYNAVHKRDLSYLYERRGDNALLNGQYFEANDFYAQSLYICADLGTIDPSNREAQRGAVVSCKKLGFLSEIQYDWAEAAACYEAGIECLEKMLDQGQVCVKDNQALAELSFRLHRVDQAKNGRVRPPAFAQKPREK